MKTEASSKRRHYRILFSYLLRHWRRMALILGLTIASSGLAVAQPWPLKLIIDNALSPSPKSHVLDGFGRSLADGSINPSVTWVFLSGALGLAIFLLNVWLGAQSSMAWARLGHRSMLDLSEDLLAHLIRQDSNFFSRYPVGDCMSRLAGDTYAIYQLADKLVVAPLNSLSTLLMVGLVAWRLNSRLTVIAFVVIPILTLLAIKYGKAIRYLRSRTSVSESSISAFALETLKVIPLVQAYQAEARNSSYFAQLAEQSISNAQRYQLFSRLLQLKGGVVGAVAAALILFIGSVDVLSGSLSLGGLLVILSYANQIRSSCNSLFVNFTAINSIDVSIQRLFELFDASPSVVDPLDPAPLPQLGVRGEIVFDRVTFRYPDGMLAIDRLDLRINPGEAIAIVGRTGAGKSTMVNLLMRFLDPVDGRVLIDGVDIRRLSLADLRSQIGYVSQQPILAPMSVAANIAYSQAYWDERRVIKAASEACAYGFIQRLPKGIHTMIGQGSTRLSGGQKQRISLARALYQQAPILLLDEPTSSLDTLTEAELMASIKLLKGLCTIVMVAHRLSTLKLADRIIVMEAGHIAELGTHEELIAARGLYHQFYEASRTVGDGIEIIDAI